jgi:magnesium transporter
MRTAEPELTPELLYLLAGDPGELATAMRGHRTADIADALGGIPPEGAAKVIEAMPFDLAVQIFDEPELQRRAAIFARIETGMAAQILEAMASDERADVFRRLPEPDQERLIRALDHEARSTIELILRYPVNSAGSLMSTEFVTVPMSWTAGQTLEHVQTVGRAKETVYAIYVVNGENRLVHVLSLREVITVPRESLVMDIGDRRRPLSVRPTTEREEVARMISRYDLLAIPVVDDRERVMGIVTVDDVIDALVSEQTEDVQRFGGMQATDRPYFRMGLGMNFRKRAGWLTVLFIGQTFTTTAMGYFEDEMQRVVLLALFIPLIISSGGNTGSQATSLIIRAMALREVRLRDWWRVASRELPVGLALGVLLGTLGLLRIIVWHEVGWYDYGEFYLRIATTVLVSLIGVVAFGSLIGSMLPFVLRRAGFDPASASAPFVATLVDVTGILIYFGVAFLILRGTLL